jgi:hypothetical protein
MLAQQESLLGVLVYSKVSLHGDRAVLFLLDQPAPVRVYHLLGVARHRERVVQVSLVLDRGPIYLKQVSLSG